MSDEVKTSFVADDKEMLAAYRRMQREVEKYRKQVAEAGQAHNKAGEQAKQAGKAKESALAGASKGIQNYVTGMVSIGAAVSTVTMLYSKWDAEIKRVTESHKAAQKEIVKTLGGGMDLRNAPQIEKALKGVGLSPEAASQAFGAATGAAPGMDWQKRAAIVAESAPLAALGQDVGANVNVATKIANLDPTINAKRAANMAAAMRARAGEDADKLASDEFMSGAAKLKAAGLSTSMALAISQAGVESDLPSKTAKSIAEALSEADPTAGQRGRLSPADKAKRAFYVQGAEGRWQALQDKATAETVLGAGGSLNVGITGDAVAQAQAVAGSDGFIASRRAEAEQWRAGKQFAEDTKTQIGMAKMDAEEGDKWGRADTLRNRYTAMMRTQGVGFLERSFRDVDMRANSMIGTARGIDPGESTARSIEDQFRTGTYNFTKEQKTEITELIKVMRENIAAVKAATPLRGSGKAINGPKE